MEKYNIVVFSIAFLILGVILGYTVSGNNKNYEVRVGTHMMPDGSVMSNNGSGGMSGMMDDMMSGLYGKTGDAFDKAFLEEMIVHHDGAVLMAQEALRNAKHQEIKDMASAIISAQTSEISQMKGWLKSWYRK
jgi:uncharacterized protein (DUF305 family)